MSRIDFEQPDFFVRSNRDLKPILPTKHELKKLIRELARRISEEPEIEKRHRMMLIQSEMRELKKQLYD